MRRVVSLVLLLGSLACGSIGSRPLPEPIPPPQHAPVTATLFVSVFDAAGAPDTKVPGATVVIEDGPHAGRTVVTDGAGNASFDGLGIAGQTICADAPGFVRLCEGVTTRGGHQAVGFLLERVQLPPPAPTHPSPLVGQLRIEGGAFVDDRGPVLPVFVHLGDGFSRYARGDSGVLDLLDAIAARGYHGVRFWTVLRGSYWAGRSVTPDETPEYWAKLEAWFRELRARRLTAVVSQGDLMAWTASSNTRDVYADELARVLGRVGPDVAAFIDAGNEAWQNGEADPARLRRFIDRLRAGGVRASASLTSPYGELKEDLRRYAYDVYDVHAYREGRWFDKLRHGWNIGYENAPVRLGISSEWTGPGRRVSVTENQHELDAAVMVGQALVSLASRQAYVYFTGPGVVSNEGEDLRSMAGFDQVMEAVALLPDDVMRWSRLVHGGNRAGSWRVFGVEDMPCDARADHTMHDDGSFIAVIYSPCGLNPKVVRPYTAAVDRTWGDKVRLVVGRVQ